MGAVAREGERHHRRHGGRLPGAVRGRDDHEPALRGAMLLLDNVTDGAFHDTYLIILGSHLRLEQRISSTTRAWQQ